MTKKRRTPYRNAKKNVAKKQKNFAKTLDK